MGLLRRDLKRTCDVCGSTWEVPRVVGRNKQRWRSGGYSFRDGGASSGIRAMSSAYQGYLGDIKRQRDAGRMSDLELAAFLETCQSCGSTRHTDH